MRLCHCFLDFDRRGLECSDVPWDRVPGRCPTGNVFLCVLYHSDPFWKLYPFLPALLLTLVENFIYGMCFEVDLHDHEAAHLLVSLSDKIFYLFACSAHAIFFPQSNKQKSDTLLNVFLAIAVDNLANAQELTKVPLYGPTA